MAKEYDLSVIFRVLDRASEPLSHIASKFQQLRPKLKAVQEEMSKLGHSAKKFGESVGRLGRGMALKFTLPIAAFGALSLKASMDFNKAMANVASLIPKSIKRVEELKRAVEEMATRTGKSTDIMAEGLYQVISAFGDSGETTNILEINAKAAAAGLATVLDAVNLTSAVMKGYGDVSGKAAQKAADLAFQTVKLGQTTFPELAAAIGGVTPLAAQLGIKQEELFNNFATLTGVTGRAAEVSTQLEGALRALLKPTEIMKKALNYLKQTGVISKATGKELLSKKGFVGAFKTLSDLAKGNEEILAKMFGRAEPLVAIFALLGPQAETYRKKLEQMWQAAGSMNEAFDEQTKGINKTGFAWEVFKIKITLLREEFGDLLSKGFSPIIDVLGRFVTWLTKLDDETKTILAVIASLIAIMGPLLMILAPLISAFGSLTLVMTLLSAMGAPALGALVAILLPILLTTLAITAAFVGVGLAVIQLTKHWKFLKQEFLKNPLSFIIDMLSILTGFIPKFEHLVILGKTLSGIFGKIGEVVKDIGNVIKDEIVGKFQDLIDYLPDFIKGKIGIGISPSSQSSATEGEGNIFRGKIPTQKSETDINIRVSSDPGSTATIEGITKRKGDANVSAATLGYVGAY